MRSGNSAIENSSHLKTAINVTLLQAGDELVNLGLILSIEEKENCYCIIIDRINEQLQLNYPKDAKLTIVCNKG